MWFSTCKPSIINIELKWPSKPDQVWQGAPPSRRDLWLLWNGTQPWDNHTKRRGKRCHVENPWFHCLPRHMIYILGGFLWVVHIYVKLYRRVPSSCACLPNQHNLLHWQPAIFFPRREALCPCASRWCWDVAVSILLCQFPVWNSPWRKESWNLKNMKVNGKD